MTIRILFLLAFLTTSAWAAEGVLEINQAGALAGGVSPSDLPGFPVTLTSGRYVLTGDLVPPPDTTAIKGTADNVKIDLAGFELVGSTAGGSAAGISITGSHWEIRNGTIRGFSNDGILHVNTGASDVQIVRLRLLDNLLDGASVWDQSTIRDTIATGNGASGLVMHGPGSRVFGSIAIDNGAGGIVILGEAGIIRDSAGRGNGTNGIQAGTGSTLENVAASGNQGLHGISCGAGCRATGVATWGNFLNGISAGDGSILTEISSYENGQFGINCGTACFVSRAVARNNTSSALNLGSDSGYQSCVLSGTASGLVAGSGIRMGQPNDNICNGSFSCP